MIFAPASITCIFSPKIAENPLDSGSMGVGFTIDRGVVAEKGYDGVELNGKRIEMPTVDYVLKKIGLEGVKLVSDLPLGCGFGLSGASAIATAFLSEKPAFHLSDLAHEAEVINLTGLGDVVTQTFGGVVVRKNASCPSKSVIERYSWDLELDFVVMGEVSTKGILTDMEKRRRITDSGKKWMKEFLRKPSVENLFTCSNGFAKETGLIELVGDAIEAVESNNGMAAMVMLGKTVFAVNGFETLKEFGEPFKARIDCCGVRKIDSSSGSVQNRRHGKC